jgi:nitrogen fixation protein NifX
VSPAAVEFVNALSTATADEAEDRNKARAALISDCQIACFQSIGGPAAAKVVRAGAHPLKVAANTRVDDMLAKLQQALQSPPPWLAKVMGVEAASLATYRELVDTVEE